MRVLISAGGTGGHIYPALAIIDKIKEHDEDSEFLYVGTHNRMENDIVPARGINFKSIEIYGFDRKQIGSIFKTMYYFIKQIGNCRKIIKEFKPDVVIGVGGYVTAPVIIAAKSLGIRTAIHEQNSIPGLSNKILIPFVDLILVSFKSSMKYFPRRKTIFTGNPCGESALKCKIINKSDLGLSKNKKLVTFVMGSLGASTVNNYFLNLTDDFIDSNYEVLFICGNKFYDELRDIKLPNNVKLVPYVDNLCGILKQTDLLISRAGASTLSEIIALKVPSILIPSPYVPNNHQYINALALSEINGAHLLNESKLEETNLLELINELINNDEKLESMKEALKQLDIKEATNNIYYEIKRLTR